MTLGLGSGAALAFPFVLGGGIGLGLPGHVIRAIRATAGKGFYVVYDPPRTGALCGRIGGAGVGLLELGYGCVASGLTGLRRACKARQRQA